MEKIFSDHAERLHHDNLDFDETNVNDFLQHVSIEFLIETINFKNMFLGWVVYLN